MFADERQEKILEMLKKDGAVNAGELTGLFDVSIETIRRDLILLEEKQCLRRVHGGAIALTKMKEFKQLSQRLEENRQGKLELSRTAATLIREGDVIAVDAGSTAMFLTQVLRNQFHRLTVVTHSLDVFSHLQDCEGFRVILCGGQFLKEENAFYGMFTLEMISKLHVDKYFLFPSAVSIDRGVADFDLELVQVQKAYLQISGQSYILADSTKYERYALAQVCPVSSKYVFITDSALPKDILAKYQKKNIRVILERGSAHE